MAFDQSWPRNTVGRNPINYGDRYHTIAAVGREGERAPYKINCRCDCGYEFTVRSTEFRRTPCPICSPEAKVRQQRDARWANGVRFGALEILGRQPSMRGKNPRFKVRCDCGREYICGQTSLAKARACQKCNPGGSLPKYGFEAIAGRTLLYRTWAAMRHRCRAISDPRYRYHAGKGIRVCDDWHDFNKFREWALANGYRPGLTIDRLDSDGNYEPSNCEWVTRAENSRRARAQYHLVKKKGYVISDDFSRYLPIEALFGNV